MAAADADPDGIFCYYPLAGPVDDPWLRELVDPRKDVEGRASAPARADVVITGVPSRSFPRVTADEIAASAICVDFSQFRNFDDSVLEKASAFIPRVGPMTVAMAMRNLVRLAAL